MKRPSNPLRCVIIGDLHVGGVCSVADPAACGQHPVCGALYETYASAATGPHARPDVLIVMGDAIEGQNRKEGGIGNWTNDLLEQARHAAELINMWKAKAVFVIRGSNYHAVAAGSGLHVEEIMARQVVNAQPCPGSPDNRSGWQWFVTLSGLTFHLQHKLGVSKVWHYRSTPMAREMLYSRLGDALRDQMGHSKTSVTIRGHAHYYLHVEHSTTHGWVAPCWKCLDGYMESNGALAIAPDIGYIAITINGESLSYEKRLWKATQAQPAPHTVISGNLRSARRHRHSRP